MKIDEYAEEAVEKLSDDVFNNTSAVYAAGIRHGLRVAKVRSEQFMTYFEEVGLHKHATAAEVIRNVFADILSGNSYLPDTQEIDTARSNLEKKER